MKAMNRHGQMVLVVMCVLAAGCQRDDRRLLGTWKSDVERSMAWNRAHVKLTEKQDSGLSQMFGHLTVTYCDRGSGLVGMEPYTLALGTNVHHMHGFTNTATYTVLNQTENSVTLKTTSGIMSDHIATVHFDGEDMYWLPLNEDDPAKSAREYFKKIGGPNTTSHGAALPRVSVTGVIFALLGIACVVFRRSIGLAFCDFGMRSWRNSRLGLSPSMARLYDKSKASTLFLVIGCFLILCSVLIFTIGVHK